MTHVVVTLLSVSVSYVDVRLADFIIFVLGAMLLLPLHR